MDIEAWGYVQAVLDLIYRCSVFVKIALLFFGVTLGEEEPHGTIQLVQICDLVSFVPVLNVRDAIKYELTHSVGKHSCESRTENGTIRCAVEVEFRVVRVLITGPSTQLYEM